MKSILILAGLLFVSQSSLGNINRFKITIGSYDPRYKEIKAIVDEMKNFKLDQICAKKLSSVDISHCKNEKLQRTENIKYKTVFGLAKINPHLLSNDDRKFLCCSNRLDMECMKKLLGPACNSYYPHLKRYGDRLFKAFIKVNCNIYPCHRGEREVGEEEELDFGVERVESGIVNIGQDENEIDVGPVDDDDLRNDNDDGKEGRKEGEREREEEGEKFNEEDEREVEDFNHVSNLDGKDGKDGEEKKALTLSLFLEAIKGQEIITRGRVDALKTSFRLMEEKMASQYLDLEKYLLDINRKIDKFIAYVDR